jgi:hypothetical protein
MLQKEYLMGNWIGTAYLAFIIVLAITGVWAIYKLARAIIFGIYITSGLKHKKELNKLTKYQLEGIVFRYDNAYFDYIGHNHPEVVEFKGYIERKDIKGLKTNWNRLATKFMDYERQAGWTGRPYILDFYCMYDVDIKELAKRV